MPVSTVVFGALFRGNHRAWGSSCGAGAGFPGGGVIEGEEGLTTIGNCGVTFRTV
jgi:hypothetical protein